MPITDLLLTGLNLMLIGMGIVFSFLIVLVFSMLAVSKLAMESDKSQSLNPPLPTSVAAPTGPPQGGARVDLVAVISAAVARYRTTHR